MPNDSAGIGDPYWYEWSVGLLHVLDMVDPASGISSVTIQTTQLQGLDDVAVHYTDGRARCIQVKHTRAADSLTFGDLVEGGLLRELATAWKKATSAGERCIPELVTNRAVGRRQYTPEDSDVTRPPLHQFWEAVKQQLNNSADLNLVTLPQEWMPGWQALRAELRDLTPPQQLEFLKLLEICGDAPGLAETGQKLRLKLARLFQCSDAQAEELLAALDHALRSWTTTTRSSALITQESVYAALGLPTEAPGTNHLIAPPEPFFPSRLRFTERIASELRAETMRVLFLTGNPGCGKTSIVSELATRRDPVVDARFHAYRPITPDTQHLPPDADLDVTPSGLWGSLLSQLRHYLRNRLAQYCVPVRNHFLTADQLKQHVLRIADAIGRDRGRAFVIAIDGIDHAVRSAAPAARALLLSVPEPAQVPANVRLLIAGQPPEAWREYPLWLHETPRGLSRLDVPQIGDEDIEALVAARSTLPPDALPVVVRLVATAARGDTLAAVFAVEEARLAASTDELSQRLEARSLHAGVRAYYDQIWEAASARLQGIHPFSGYRIGAVLALFDQRVSPERLNDIFGENSLPAEDWFEALLMLRPLVVQEGDGFRLTHNDVRVYLTAKLRAEPQRLTIAAGKIADYCRSNPRAGRSRFTLTFPMLVLSQRGQECAAEFTPSYVAAAWRHGLALDLTQDQAKEALRAVAQLPNAWDQLHAIVCALATIEQIDRSSEFAQFPQTEARDSGVGDPLPITALPSECHVAHVSKWTATTVTQVLRDALRLNASDPARARGLFRHWFAGVTPGQLAQHVRAAADHVQPEEVSGASRLFGNAVWACGLSAAYTSVPIENGMEAEWAHFFSGYLDGAKDQSPVAWARALRSLRRYYPADLEELVTDQADKGRWRQVAFSLFELTSRRPRLSGLFHVRAAAWALLLGYDALQASWIEPVLKAPFQNATDATQWDAIAEIAVTTSFVLGWCTVRPVEGIRDDAVASCGHHWRNDSLRRVSFLCFAAATIGRWFGLSTCPLSAAQLETLLSRLLEPAGGFEVRSAQDRLSKDLVRLTIEAASHDQSQLDLVRSVARTYAEKGRHGPSTPYLWSLLAAQSEMEVLRNWITKRFGPAGNGWRASTHVRVEQLATFEMLARGSGLSSEASLLAELKRSAVLGYVDHKDYALAYPIKWFEALLPTNPGIWSVEGLRLLALSREADVAGDNRESIDVDAAVAAAACLAGPSALLSLDEARDADGEQWFEPNSRHWINGLLSASGTLSVSANDLRAIWSLAVGQLSWRYQRDVEYLADAREAIVAVAERLGLQQETSVMETCARLEWTFARDYVHRDSYRRWRPYEREPGEEQRSLAITLNEIPLRDAISRLESLLGGERSFPHVTEQLAQRIASQQPTEAPELAWMLFEVVSHANETTAMGWRYNGSQRTFKPLARFMTAERRWDVVRSVIRRLDTTDWPATFLKDDLDDWCLATSTSDGVLQGLRRHLDTQTQWVGPPRQLPIPTVSDLDRQLDWPTYAMQALLGTLASDSALLSLSAMRGLSALVTLLPAVADELGQRATALGRADQEVIGQLVEYLASNNPTVFARFLPFLEHASSSGFLELELQSWIARSADAIARNQPLPPLVLARRPSVTPRVLSGSRLVVREPVGGRAAESTTEFQAVAALLRQLLIAANVDTPAIEAAFLASLDVTPLTGNQRTHKVRSSDLAFADTGHVERLLDVIRSGVSGSIPRAFAVRLAQALLEQDEPAVIYGDWNTSSGWPTDKELASAVSAGREGVRSLLMPLLHAGLEPNQRVFGGMVHVCTREQDIFFYVLPLLRDSDTRITARRDATEFGGRVFAFTEEDRFERYEGEPPPRWLALKGRGLSRTPHQNFGVTISPLVQQGGGWTFQSASPPKFLAGDGSVVRYERIHGPRRDNNQERTFRDPFLERWVCAESAIADLETRLGGTVTLTPDAEVTGEEALYDEE